MTDCWIGIDQSYGGFGLCVLRDADHETTVTEFPSVLHGEGVDRLDAIGRWFSERIRAVTQTYRVAHVCMEGYAYGTTHGREEAGELGAVVKTVLRYLLDDPACYPTIVAPSSLKKFATADGRANKSLVVQGVKTRWGVDFEALMTKTRAHNAADAYVLARIAQAMEVDSGDYREMRIREALTPHTEQRVRGRA